RREVTVAPHPASELFMRSLLPCLFSLLLPLSAFSQDDEEKRAPGNEPIKVVKLPRKDPVSYDKDVEPIFTRKCIVCHSGKETKGELDLGSYESLIKGGKRGKEVVPGKAEKSQLYLSAGKVERPYIPPRKDPSGGQTVPLTPEELAIIKLWIDQGAKAPTGPRAKVAVVVGVPPAIVHPVRAVAVSPDKSAVIASRG